MKGFGPAVQRLLRENPSINLSLLKPIGKSGRITKTDILNFLENPPKAISSSIPSNPSNPRQKITFQDVPNTKIPNIRKLNPHSFMKTEIPYLPEKNIVQLFKSILRRHNKFIVYTGDKYIENPRERELNTLLVTEYSAAGNMFLSPPYLYHINISTKSTLLQVKDKPIMKKMSIIDFTFDTRILDPAEGAEILDEITQDAQILLE